MLFCVLNTWRFPCPRTHMLHVRKLAEGFVQRGFHYKEINNVEELSYLASCDVVYISNHFSCDKLHSPFERVLRRELMPRLQRCKAKMILWSFHTLQDWSVLEQLPAHVLHLGEDLYEDAIAAEPVLSAFRRKFDVLMLRYGSPMHPQHSGFYDLNRIWDFNFVGAGYKQSLTKHCQDRYRALIRNTPPAISEPLRINSFRLSAVNLVFHADNNVRKGIVVERFPEALSFGGIIFHDHPRIESDFPSLPSLFRVNTAAEIDQAFDTIRSMSMTDLTDIRLASFHAWKCSELSYFHQAGRILDAFQQRMG